MFLILQSLLRKNPQNGPFVYRLGRKIFILERAVRFCYGLRLITKYQSFIYNKRIRQSETRRLRNRYYSKTMRNAVRNIRKMTDAKEAAEAMPKVVAMLDKLAGKNVISKNKASNLKSKLAQHVNKLNKA